MTFAEYLASRKRHPINSWGDFVRYGLKTGTLRDFSSWDEFRLFLVSGAGTGIEYRDAQKAWNNYQTSVRKKGTMMRVDDMRHGGQQLETD